MPPPTIDDYAWLTSAEADRYFTRAQDHTNSLTSLAKSLRKELSLPRTHLILEQVELRERARVKFTAADRMFFTRQTLEQATNEVIADYVASRFPQGTRIADLCCGAGGNLLAFGNRGPTTGVEVNPLIACCARANARLVEPHPVSVVVADAANFSLAGHAAFFIDPDRRAHGRRTVDLRFYQPDLAALERLLETCPDAGIKLAPATAVPDHWRASAELQWIGHARQCKQQVAWFGKLARRPGMRVATICHSEGQAATTTVEKPQATPARASDFQRFIYVAHPCLVAARLVSSIAQEYELAQVVGNSDLLTGNHLIFDGALASFETVAECPAKLSRLRSLLGELDIAPMIVRAVGGRDAARKLVDKISLTRGTAGGVFFSPSQTHSQATVAIRRRADES